MQQLFHRSIRSISPVWHEVPVVASVHFHSVCTSPLTQSEHRWLRQQRHGSGMGSGCNCRQCPCFSECSVPGRASEYSCWCLLSIFMVHFFTAGHPSDKWIQILQESCRMIQNSQDCSNNLVTYQSRQKNQGTNVLEDIFEANFC